MGLCKDTRRAPMGFDPVELPLPTSSAGPSLERACLLVLGMHRSGTSAVCGVLSELGGVRPLHEMPPSPHNEKGYFESAVISSILDRMLESAGLQWFDWEQLPASWRESASCESFVTELAEAVHEDFPGVAPFILKDPRICRFTDVWLAVLKRLEVQPVVVLPYRHPAEVAQSLKARDGFPVAHSLLMWMRHILDAEVASRTTERSFVNFADLMDDWQTALSRVLNNERVFLPKQSARAFAVAEDFLDGSLRHQTTNGETVRDVQHPWIQNTYRALQRLRENPYDESAMEALDGVRAEFDSACAAFTPAFHQLWLRLRQMDRDAARETRDETADAKRMPLLEAELVETLSALAAIKPEVDRVHALESELTAVTQRNTDLQRALDAAVLQLDQTTAATERLLAVRHDGRQDPAVPRYADRE